MDWRRRKRQVLFLLTALLLPAAVLIGLSVRMYRQESELADNRLAAEKRNALDQLRRELTSKLEAIKLKEVSRFRDDRVSAMTLRSPDPTVVFMTSFAGDRMMMPWEDRSRPPKPSVEYRNRLRESVAAEFQLQDLAGALAALNLTLAAAREPQQKCETRLALARVLLKSGRREDSSTIYRDMLRDCDTVADEDGVSFGLYAAERLVANQLDVAAAKAYVAQRAALNCWWAPAQAYLMRSLLDEVPEGLTSEIRDADQMVMLARDLRAMPPFRLDFPFAERPGDSSWLAYGADPWLITVISPDPPSPPVVLAISSGKIAPPGVVLTAQRTPSGVALGERFMGLSVEWPAGRFAPREQRSLASLYITGVILILAATGLAGFLLMRDVNREVQMADLRSHFVASVSHELKTPLTAIRMFAETLAMGRARTEQAQAEYLQTIVNESERLSRLVDNVLDFSRIERGKKSYRMEPVLLADVVRSAARAMGYPLSQQGFNLRLSVDNELPAVMADADAIQQAILNLITNAMKYSGDVREIELRLRRKAEDAVIDVTDHGIGIPPEEHAHIFDKFYRIRSRETDLVAGTGLGLTLVSHIVKAHGGRVEVTSKVGEGSTFSIVLPLRGSESAS